MSVAVMAAVWSGFPHGGSELLCMLALADFADENGGNIFPSMTTLAQKLRVDKRNAQRIVRKLEADGFIEKIEASNGGARIATNRMRIRLDRLTRGENATRGSSATRGDDATPTRGKNATLPVALAPPNTSTKRQVNRQALTLRRFLEDCKAAGEKPIPENDAIFAYAEQAGIDEEMLEVAWREFKASFLPTSKTQRDWRAHYRNAIRRNWYGLWFLREGEAARWTTAGEQARRVSA